MSATPGAVVRSRWVPLRQELERILADGVWRQLDVVFAATESFIDPRMAARQWARTYDSVTRRNKAQRLPGASVFHAESRRPGGAGARFQRHALHIGGRAVFYDTLRGMQRAGRAEIQTWYAPYRCVMVRGTLNK